MNPRLNKGEEETGRGNRTSQFIGMEENRYPKMAHDSNIAGVRTRGKLKKLDGWGERSCENSV